MPRGSGEEARMAERRDSDRSRGDCILLVSASETPPCRSFSPGARPHYDLILLL